MIYHLNIILNGQRKTVILEHTLQEYGISEQEFWSCWIADEKQFNGDGGTLKVAFKDMLNNMEYRKEMWRISADMREHFNKSMIGSVGIRCPVIG